MVLSSNSYAKLYVIIFVLGIFCISYKLYRQVIFVQKQRKQIINNFYDADLENTTYEESLRQKYKERRIHARNIMKMKAIIKEVNLRQRIYNQNLKSTFTHIIVIQVHSDVYLFQQLLASLKAAHSIHNALLIFSHDVFDPEINKAVHSVYFAKYMQIFYPYSTQLHPYVFPSNCQGGKTCEKTITRDAAAAQKKHHWWWQMNQVFDHLNATANYNKSILLLEEGNYVTKDFFFIYMWLENALAFHCSVCDMISLGANEPEPILYTENASISVMMWGENTPNIGIGFHRSTWQAIKNSSKEFCYFNDYTWDNSLKHIGSKQMDTNFYLAAIDGARVFHIDKCDEKDFSCKLEEKVKEVTKFLEVVNDSLFPWTITTFLTKSEDYYKVKPLGSFSDERDHGLCMYFAENNVWY